MRTIFAIFAQVAGAFVTWSGEMIMGTIIFGIGIVCVCTTDIINAIKEK